MVSAFLVLQLIYNFINMSKRGVRKDSRQKHLFFNFDILDSLLLGVMILVHVTDLFFFVLIFLFMFFLLRFFDAYTNGNLYLCGDLVRLFALCPMTGHRLKSDPSTNQAPRILRQLSTDARIEAEIRNLATQVIVIVH